MDFLPRLEVVKELGINEVDIEDIAYDSRRVKKGSLFFCIKGFKTDGHLYIKEAVKNGARAVITQEWQEDTSGVTQIQVKNSRIALAEASNVFFGEPSSKLSLIGITGTNGKTTTAYLIESILKEAGQPAGLIGTIECRIGKKQLPIERTTPESYDLCQILDKMLEQGARFAVMEVSSHAISLERVRGLQFAVLVFTNLSPEHLDYHKNLNEYFTVKKSLFEGGFGQPIHVINVDDKCGREIAQLPAKKVYRYGLKNPCPEPFDVACSEPLNFAQDKLRRTAQDELSQREADLGATDIKLVNKQMEFIIQTPQGSIPIKTKLQGLFNIYNLLAAASSSIALGIDLEAVKLGLEKVERVPGRFETVDVGQNFAVIVDYAHTPEALEKAIASAREVTKRRVITVFGCGGDRDRTKRPLMGRASAFLSDLTIVTTDNPRSEDPEVIIGEILEGVEQVKSANYREIADRKEAIAYAISKAKEGDLVLIAGKGHERGQIFADRTIPFDDKEVARDILTQKLQ